MTSVDKLLPANSEPFERALGTAMTDTLPVPLRAAMDPLQTPADLLPWLAVHEGVHLWWSDWSEARKRQIIAEWPRLAWLIGTRAAAERFLAYVDTTIIHKVSHPSRWPVGGLAVGIDPINHPPHTARYLVKTELKAPAAAICVGMVAVGHASIRPPDPEPLNRALVALSTSKAPDKAYSVSFAHRRRVTLDDGIDLATGHHLGQYMDRTRL